MPNGGSPDIFFPSTPHTNNKFLFVFFFYFSDIVLEYEDSELYQQFKDFYEDVLPEFKNVGEVVQFKVCCNYQSHLRGNVYIQFAR